ncbi:competence type IV pilus minor pilin ComGG [Bacillus paranthracis]|uniref:competence type IV pilus minor pilin ComGG n=1 Tax=Bacillus cereus group TaxID=86661 RepID=UPI0022E8C9BE|nr:MULTISPECIES: competence type IV pilus minor pilin ComGG [Bacillus cereus group]MBL3843508.1 competence protein ComG [Bacillus cereus]MDA1889381.1 competence type IV pilus minor pilin ComGG [Bacillus cereus group sp. BY11-1LC]MDA2592127.1 competence type IV pilus minor pilin ComGG [Bacillus cereus group sp. Bc065]MDK7441033.1 competence type IV pilus minor pilin ComGG [Bacillus paranthracis]MDK7457453.1 competence type IV pilus minor pilin ComGG [Bacillus paranthracis]
MIKQDGFTMPGTIIFLILFTSFFIYETNMLLIDKKFYIEIEQKFVLEEILNQSIRNIKKDLRQKEKEDTFFFSYEKGEASGNYVFENDVILVSLQCKIKQEVFYKVSFRYRKKDEKIFDWIEG